MKQFKNFHTVFYPQPGRSQDEPPEANLQLQALSPGPGLPLHSPENARCCVVEELMC